MSVTVTNTLSIALSTNRDIQVSFLRQLDKLMRHARVTHDMLVGFTTPTRTMLFAVTAEEAGDDYIPEDDDWLARIVTDHSRRWVVDSAGETVLEEDVITGFVVGFTPTWPVAFTVGYTAAGTVEDCTLAFGQPALSDMEEPLREFLNRQARILWGSAWSPLLS